jgi:hypothetical protein
MSCNDKRIPKVDLSAFKVVHPDVKLLEKLAKTNELGYKLEDAIKSNLKVMIQFLSIPNPQKVLQLRIVSCRLMHGTFIVP